MNGTATGSTTQTRIGTPTLNGSGSNLASVIGGVGSNIASQLGDPASSSGTTLISNIGGSTTSVQAALNALSTILVNSTSFSSSLTTLATTQSTNLDNGLSSLPNSGTFATIGTVAASDGSGGVNIVISSGLSGADGTYNLSAVTITGAITNGSTFTLTKGGNNLVLTNRSGTTISTQAQAISYLASMYPSSSQIATGISDKISNGLNKLVGGSTTSVRARIAAVDRGLLATPTGVLATDLATVAGLVVTSPSGVVQTDIQTINSLLNGTASGSTIQVRIGSPTVNGSGSSLATVIGGSGSDIATLLGDPVSGTTGLSSRIKNNGTVSNVSFNCAPFNNAATLYDQLTAFLALVDTGTTIPAGSYSSLADVINAMT